MSRGNDAQKFWDALRCAHPRRTRFTLEHLLETFRRVFPHRDKDTNARSVLVQLLAELEDTSALRLPKATNRRAYDHSERTSLPKHVTRLDRPCQANATSVAWRPELSFAHQLRGLWQEELLLIQDWLRRGGTTAPAVALRERSVEIFGDEKRLDALLGTQIFAPGHLTLETLRCYPPSIPIYMVPLAANGSDRRPILVVENHTTFDTLCRWNERSKTYAGVAFGAGAAFVSGCKSLHTQVSTPNSTGEIKYFGDIDPKGLWIPARAQREVALKITPETALYTLLLRKGATHRRLPQHDIRFEVSLLEWLPLELRPPITRLFKTGRRLPQELLSLHDLPATLDRQRS